MDDAAKHVLKQVLTTQLRTDSRTVFLLDGVAWDVWYDISDGYLYSTFDTEWDEVNSGIPYSVNPEQIMNDIFNGEV